MISLKNDILYNDNNFMTSMRRMKMNKTWAYARVSSCSQKLDRQFERLKEYVVDESFILCDLQSEKDFERSKWRLLNNILDEGDTSNYKISPNLYNKENIVVGMDKKL